MHEIDSDSLWANIRSYKDEIRIGEETIVYLYATNKEREDLEVFFELNIPNSFSINDMFGESPKILKPGQEMLLKKYVISPTGQIKELITAYIRYNYIDENTEPKDLNLSLCVNVK